MIVYIRNFEIGIAINDQLIRVYDKNDDDDIIIIKEQIFQIQSIYLQLFIEL